MNSILIKGARIITPTEILPRGSVFLDRGRIRAVARGKLSLPRRPERTINAPGKTLIPGYIDLQVNGGKGEGFSESPAADYEMIVRFFAEHGTTTMLATVLTDTPERMLESIRRVVSFRESRSKYARLVAGVHVEGPFLNPARRGAHPVKLLRGPNEKEIRSWLKAA